MEVIVTIASKLVYNLFRRLTTYLYRGYNPVTKYHRHPTSIISENDLPNLPYLIIGAGSTDSMGSSRKLLCQAVSIRDLYMLYLQFQGLYCIVVVLDSILV